MTVATLATSTTDTVLSAKSLPPEVKEPLLQVLRWTLWLAFVFFVGCVMWAGNRFYWIRREGIVDSDAAADVVVILVLATVASVAAGIAAAILTF